MIELKLDDINTLFPDTESLKDAQSKFPIDPLGDLLIRTNDFEYKLQKNILGKNSAYFGQLATIKYLQTIEIQEKEIDSCTFYKCLKVLYGFQEKFDIQDLEKIFSTINFIRSKDMKSSLIGEIKILSKKLPIDNQMIIFFFSFEKQIMTLSSYFMDSFVKQKLGQQLEENKKSFLVLDEKSFVVLMTHLYQNEIQEEKQEGDLIQIFIKIFEFYSNKKHLNLSQIKQKFEVQVQSKKDKLIHKEDQKKDVVQLAKELRDLRNSHEIQLKKVDDMKKSEKKHQHIITNLTQKMKCLEKAVLYHAQNNEEIQNILKPKKKKKPSHSNDEDNQSKKIIQLYNRNKQEIQVDKKNNYNDIIPILVQKYNPNIQQLLEKYTDKQFCLIFDGLNMEFQLNLLFRQEFNGIFIFLIKTEVQSFGLITNKIQQGRFSDPNLAFFNLNPLVIFNLKEEYKQKNNVYLNDNQFKFGDDIQILIKGKPDCNLFTIGQQFSREFIVLDNNIVNIQIFNIE